MALIGRIFLTIKRTEKKTCAECQLKYFGKQIFKRHDKV